MTIKKYLHSCLLLEEAGKRLLIDPGLFCFIEGKLKPEDIGPVDVIVLTHQHPDHYWPEALKKISALQPTNIVTHAEIGALLEKDGVRSLASASGEAKLLNVDPIEAGEIKTVAGFEIKAIAAPHGPIPAALPHNLAYLINNTVLHPGDSFDVIGSSPLGSNNILRAESRSTLPLLALPTFAPWARLVDALAFAKRLKPQHVIPIHDAHVKDFMLERMNAAAKAHLEANGIAFHPLNLDEEFTI